ncbi:MAG: type II toxin-antitoxin system prevent-host-death family antitoxin [Bradymonadales bacterium]|nr:type II toxin-antitoxin system prevent-host-death family antitoxin [Bradymonadales bacterium]
MKTATITQTKNQLSALLDEVRQGEIILILDRGRPVARLVPAAGWEEGLSAPGRIERLERSGVLKRAEHKIDRLLPLPPPPRLTGGGSVLQALLEEREEGR